MLDLLLVNKLFNTILLITIDLIAIWISLWVLLTNRKNLVNQLFFLLSLSILSWFNAAYFFTFSKNYNEALLWARFGISGAFVFLIFFYLFSTNFLRKKEKIHFLEKIFFVIVILLTILTFSTDLIVKNIEFTSWGANIIFTFYGRVIFYGMVILTTVFALFQIFRNYFQFSQMEKLKTQYFLIGFLIFIILNIIFNVFFPILTKTIKYWQFGNYSTIFLPIFTAYAIVKKELFGIKVILTDLLVGLIAILLLVNILVSETILDYVWKGSIFFLFCIFGYYLIKSTYEEGKRREEAERLAGERSKLAEQFQIVAIQSTAFKQTAEEIAQRERKLRKKAEKIAQDFQRLTDIRNQMFLTGQHHTRTHLSNIQNFARHLLEGGFGPINKDQKQALQTIVSKVQESIELANLYLSVSEFEAGKGFLDKKEYQFKRISQRTNEEVIL